MRPRPTIRKARAGRHRCCKTGRGGQPSGRDVADGECRGSGCVKRAHTQSGGGPGAGLRRRGAERVQDGRTRSQHNGMDKRDADRLASPAEAEGSSLPLLRAGSSRRPQGCVDAPGQRRGREVDRPGSLTTMAPARTQFNVLGLHSSLAQEGWHEGGLHAECAIQKGVCRQEERMFALVTLLRTRAGCW